MLFSPRRIIPPLSVYQLSCLSYRSPVLWACHCRRLINPLYTNFAHAGDRFAMHSASGASGSSAHGVSDALFSEPHEYRDEQRMLVKMLGQMQSGHLPAQLLPLLRSFHTAVMEAPCSRCHLLALSHDELGVVVDGLCDPLQPVVAVALSSTCKGLRTPLLAALEMLKQRHSRALVLSLLK